MTRTELLERMEAEIHILPPAPLKRVARAEDLARLVTLVRSALGD